jgi:hypothetical protein
MASDETGAAGYQGTGIECISLFFIISHWVSPEVNHVLTGILFFPALCYPESQ